jgi:hypothetical protein
MAEAIASRRGQRRRDVLGVGCGLIAEIFTATPSPALTTAEMR